MLRWLPAVEFDDVYRDYWDQINGFCRGLCGDPEEAEDLAQDVFVTAYLGLPAFRSGTLWSAGRSRALRRWLVRIALRRWERVRRSRPDTAPLETAWEMPDPDAGQELVELDQALQILPEQRRAAFVLVRRLGLSYREAAETLDVPISTVQTWVRESAAQLRTVYFGPVGAEEPPRRQAAKGHRRR